MKYLLEISWSQIFMGEQNILFLLEVFIRTLIMFIILVTGIKLMGKRGIKQLSLFELVVIIGLGSAAGDPMFYEEVGILQAIVVFFTVIFLYRLITFLVAKNPFFEELIEGKPIKVIEEGKFCIDGLQKNLLGDDEFFLELRQEKISHLGQIKLAILETNGSMSVYFYRDELVKKGLPILPDLFKHKQKNITHEAFYSCTFCGQTDLLQVSEKQFCNNCGKDEWVLSIEEKRVT